MSSAQPVTLTAPREEYRSYATVDPAACADLPTAETVARGVFAGWIRQSPIAPADPNTLLSDVTLQRYHWGRLQSEIFVRKAVWHEEAYTGPPEVVVSPRVEMISDPWSTSPEELRRLSCHVCLCEGCGGGGLVNCPDCGGSSRIRCSNCEGTGKAYGFAKNGSRRLMNCRVCAGHLELQCPACESGHRECLLCSGSGRKVRWVEVVQSNRVDVNVGPDENLSWLFPWKTTAASTSRAEMCADVIAAGEVTADGMLPVAHVASVAPSWWLERNWNALQPAVQPHERVVRQTFSVFVIPIFDLTYAFPGALSTTVRFEGLRMFAPPVLSDPSIAGRARRIRLSRNVLSGIVAGVALLYLARGQYFQSPAVAILLSCLVAAAFSTYRLVRGVTLFGLARSRRWAWFAAGAGLVLIASAVQAEPSLRTAQRLLSADQIDAARVELLALGSPEQPAQADVWNSLHLAIAQKANDPDTIRGELSQIGPRTPQRAACARKLGEVAAQGARDQLAAKQWQQAETLLAAVVPELSGGIAGDPLLSELAEVRALAQDQAYAACGSEVCRMNASRSALSFAVTPAREQRLAASRQNVYSKLQYKSDGRVTALERLRLLRAIEGIVAEAGDQADAELTAQMRGASETVRRERARIPLIGADSAVLGELLGSASFQSSGILKFEVGSVSLYANMRGGRCVGTYIVGANKEQRTLNDSGQSANAGQLLSQSLGSLIPLPAQTGKQNSSGVMSTSSRIGNVTVVARWIGAALKELRVGEAQP